MHIICIRTGKDYVDMLKLQVAKIGNPAIDDQSHVSVLMKSYIYINIYMYI